MSRFIVHRCQQYIQRRQNLHLRAVKTYRPRCTVQRCQTYCSKVSDLLFKDVRLTVQRYHTYCSKMSGLLFKDVRLTVQRCHTYCPKMTYLLSKDVKLTVQRCQTYCSKMSDLLFKDVRLTVQSCGDCRPRTDVGEHLLPRQVSSVQSSRKTNLKRTQSVN